MTSYMLIGHNIYFKMVKLIMKKIILLFILIFSCTNSDHQNLMELGVITAVVDQNLYNNRVRRFIKAMEEWKASDINFEYSIGSTRDENDPQNWVTYSTTDCNAFGIHKKEVCKGSKFIGLCLINYSSNTITVSSIVIDEKYQNAMNVSEEEKVKVFIHEIGHCLGLDHSDNRNDVMFPDTSGALYPSEKEKQAIFQMYSGQTVTDSFRFVNGDLRNESIKFVLSADVGNLWGSSTHFDKNGPVSID